MLPIFSHSTGILHTLLFLNVVDNMTAFKKVSLINVSCILISNQQSGGPIGLCRLDRNVINAYIYTVGRIIIVKLILAHQSW